MLLNILIISCGYDLVLGQELDISEKAAKEWWTVIREQIQRGAPKTNLTIAKTADYIDKSKQTVLAAAIERNVTEQELIQLLAHGHDPCLNTGQQGCEYYNYHCYASALSRLMSVPGDKVDLFQAILGHNLTTGCRGTLEGSLNEYLVTAAFHGNARIVEQLISQGADVNSPSDDGYLALAVAACSTHKESVPTIRVLLEHGANASLRETSHLLSASAIHFAAQCGRTRTLGLLLRNISNVDPIDRWENTPLHHACRRGKTEAAEMLLKSGADPNSMSPNGETALYLAMTSTGDAKLLQVLLEHGADPMLGFSENSEKIVWAWGYNNPVYEAVGNPAVLLMLLQNGAQPLVDRPGAPNGQTALHRAAHERELESAKVLLDFGANVTARSAVGTTPLHAATDWSTEVMNLLLARGANVDDPDDLGRSPLFSAVSHGPIEAVILLLEHGANISSYDYERNTALHVAAGFQTGLEKVKLLLTHGADVQARNEAGDTPLHEAIGFIDYFSSETGQRQEIIDVLLEAGAEIDALNSMHRTPLHLAAQRKSMPSVQALLKHGANVSLLDTQDCTPLHYAMLVDNATIMLPLLVAGATPMPERCSSRALRPLHTAVAANSSKVLEMLLQRGADVSKRTSDGTTALHLAVARNRSLEMIKLLVDFGCDVNAVGENLDTPIFHSLFYNLTDIAEFLIQQKAKLDHKNKFDEYPLHFAADSDIRADLFEAVLQATPDMNARDVHGWTPLHCAVGRPVEYRGWHRWSWCTPRSLEQLIKAGADLDIGDTIGFTPLHTAVKGIFSDTGPCAATLLQSGASVDSQNKYGQTPLHVAVVSDPRFVLLLIDGHANVSAVDLEGQTPLHYWAQASPVADGEIPKLLTEEGANVNAQDNRGWTPLHFAADQPSCRIRGNTDIVSQLMDNGADILIKDDEGRDAADIALLGYAASRCTKLLISARNMTTHGR